MEIDGRFGNVGFFGIHILENERRFGKVRFFDTHDLDRKIGRI